LAKSRYDWGAIAAILRRRGLPSVAAHRQASLFGFLFDVMLQQQQ
jgi:hypothetical protein